VAAANAIQNVQALLNIHIYLRPAVIGWPKGIKARGEVRNNITSTDIV
jgi:hypothetical protein